MNIWRRKEEADVMVRVLKHCLFVVLIGATMELIKILICAQDCSARQAKLRMELAVKAAVFSNLLKLLNLENLVFL